MPMTEEEKARGKRFSEIFMPWSSRHTDRFYAATSPPKFAHYTSAETALKIIREKRLWMRNVTAMADYREVQHGRDMLLRAMAHNDRQKAKEFIGALDACRPGVADAASKLFDDNWFDISNNTFIASVSEHDARHEDDCGRLSMWRAFSSSSARVCLVFALPRIPDVTNFLSLVFAPVAYWADTTMHDEIDSVIANVKANRDWISQQDPELLKRVVFMVFLASAVGVKHPGFHEEREWRAVYGPLRWRSELMEKLMSVEYPFGIPQRVFKIPLDVSVSKELADLDLARILDRVIIGPSQYPQVMADAFVRELVNIGIPLEEARTRVFASDIPIRT